MSTSSGGYKLIAIDLDGTLLSPTAQVTPRTKAAIHRCLEAGLLVCFATGRNWTESQLVLDAVSHYASAVFVGGALVVDTGEKLTLHRVLMDPQLAREICEAIESAGHAANAAQEPASGSDYVVTGDIELANEMAHWLKATRSSVQIFPRLATFHHRHTIRVTAVAPPGALDRIQKTLDERFADRIFFHRIAIPHTGMELIEIFDPSVNKWEGILHVARRHDVQPGEIIAIGDDMNDLHMIREAGLGVAMGNAKPEIQRLAKRVIGSNQEDGLAVFLEELVERQEVEPAEGHAA